MLVLESHASSTEAFAKTITLVTVWTSFTVPSNKLLECVLFSYRTVFGRLLQTLCDELGSDAPAWQVVNKRVHQSYSGSIPSSLRRVFTHLVTEVSHIWAKMLFHNAIPSDYGLILILHFITAGHWVITLYSTVRLALWRYLLIPNHMVPLSWALLIGVMTAFMEFFNYKK